MSFATRHNKGSVFNCNTEGFEYFSLETLFNDNGPDEVYKLLGIYINKKSEYGDAPVAICTDCFVNFPQHMLDECRDIMKDADDIAAIRDGKVGFKIEPYEKAVGKKTKTCYGVQWVDIDD